jgi:hypothetical protein
MCIIFLLFCVRLQHRGGNFALSRYIVPPVEYHIGADVGFGLPLNLLVCFLGYRYKALFATGRCSRFHRVVNFS